MSHSKVIVKEESRQLTNDGSHPSPRVTTPDRKIDLAGVMVPLHGENADDKDVNMDIEEAPKTDHGQSSYYDYELDLWNSPSRRVPYPPWSYLSTYRNCPVNKSPDSYLTDGTKCVYDKKWKLLTYSEAEDDGHISQEEPEESWAKVEYNSEGWIMYKPLRPATW